MKKKFIFISFLLSSLLLFACEGSVVEEDFDPSPYLTQVYQSLKNHENKTIDPIASKWIYTYAETESLSVFHLFVEFNIQDDGRIKYAILTNYIDRDQNAVENTFVDRMYNDELGADVSSLSSYNTFYTTVLGDMQSIPDHMVLTGVIELALITTAMQGVV
jgi:hypothetical protein